MARSRKKCLKSRGKGKKKGQGRAKKGKGKTAMSSPGKVKGGSKKKDSKKREN